MHKELRRIIDIEGMSVTLYLSLDNKIVMVEFTLLNREKFCTTLDDVRKKLKFVGSFEKKETYKRLIESEAAKLLKGK